MTDILQEASELINGQRAKDYGPASENFQRIADLFAAYLGDTDTDDLDTYDVANMMILVKLARLKSAGYHRDSYADIAGYAALAEKIHGPEVPTFTLKFEKTEPRVWASMYDVPLDVSVTDRQGDTWKYFDGVWHWGNSGGPWIAASTLARRDEDPFTEVLDIEPEGSE